MAEQKYVTEVRPAESLPRIGVKITASITLWAHCSFVAAHTLIKRHVESACDNSACSALRSPFSSYSRPIVFDLFSAFSHPPLSHCTQHEAEAQRKMHAAQEVAYVAEKHLLAQEKALKQAQAVRV